MNKLTAGAKALHAHEGDTHVVGVLALRVLLVEDTSGWFAQGLDIDYAASGDTADAAKHNFQEGFCATVHEHLVMHGDINRLLKPAEQDAWKEFYETPKLAKSFSCIQLHNLESEKKAQSQPKDFPFDTIAFLQRTPTKAVSQAVVTA